MITLFLYEREKSMMYVKMFAWSMVLTGVACLGCNQPANPTKPNPGPVKGGNQQGKTEDGGHSHGKGPNGGVVFDLGKYHAEFTVDHGKKECTVLIVTGDNKDAEPMLIAAKEFTLTTKVTKTKEGKEVAPMTISMKPVDAKDGKGAKFVGTDPGLGNVADFEGTVVGEIDGKPSKGEFKE
jgi:hypothetical protein